MTHRFDVLPRSDLGLASDLLERACVFDEVRTVAEEKLFCEGALGHAAQPLGVWDGCRLVAVACTSAVWLRLLAVCPTQRRRNLGSQLLRLCERQIARHGASARIMAQPGNYLSPGIDARNQECIAWLEKRGYEKSGSACNVLIALRENSNIDVDHVNAMRMRTEMAGYEIQRMSQERIAGDIAVINQDYSAGWAWEVSRSAQADRSGVHIAVQRDTGELAGFAAHDGNNQGLGWFGPTATLSGHRGRGVGRALLLASLFDVAAAGHTHAQVAWIGPRAFYDRVVGISGERTFVMMDKRIEKNI